MKGFAAALGLAMLLLQYRLWFSGDGVSEVLRMKAAVSAQEDQNRNLSERNRQLSAEVRDLKQGFVALEERARTDLGMIGTNETFFQVVPGESHAPDASIEPTPAGSSVHTAANDSAPAAAAAGTSGAAHAGAR